MHLGNNQNTRLCCSVLHSAVHNAWSSPQWKAYPLWGFVFPPLTCSISILAKHMKHQIKPLDRFSSFAQCLGSKRPRHIKDEGSFSICVSVVFGRVLCFSPEGCRLESRSEELWTWTYSSTHTLVLSLKHYHTHSGDIPFGFRDMRDTTPGMFSVHGVLMSHVSFVHGYHFPKHPSSKSALLPVSGWLSLEGGEGRNSRIDCCGLSPLSF